MTEKYRPEKGDRVRVVLEGVVEPGIDGFFLLSSLEDDSGHANFIWPDEAHVVSIEKVEPPVVQFQPGDIVRHNGSGLIFVLGKNGYTHITTYPGLYRTYESVCYGSPEDFNSKGFTKIELVEKPF